jgi:hypothetical protein
LERVLTLNSTVRFLVGTGNSYTKVRFYPFSALVPECKNPQSPASLNP